MSGFLNSGSYFRVRLRVGRLRGTGGEASPRAVGLRTYGDPHGFAFPEAFSEATVEERTSKLRHSPFVVVPLAALLNCALGCVPTA